MICGFINCIFVHRLTCDQRNFKEKWMTCNLIHLLEKRNARKFWLIKFWIQFQSEVLTSLAEDSRVASLEAMHEKMLNPRWRKNHFIYKPNHIKLGIWDIFEIVDKEKRVEFLNSNWRIQVSELYLPFGDFQGASLYCSLELWIIKWISKMVDCYRYWRND